MGLSLLNTILGGRVLKDFDLETMIFVANEAGNTAMALYMTAISGYLIVAYAVGKELNRSQVILVNGLFLFFSISFSYSTIISFLAMRQYEILLEQTTKAAPTLFSLMENTFVAMVTLGLATGIVGALMFMRNIRSAFRKN
jgi:hypothetical protein